MKNNTKKMIFCSLALIGLLGDAVAQHPASGTVIAHNADTTVPRTSRTRSVSLSGTQINVDGRGEQKSKEVSQEVNMPKNGEIYIQNSYRSIQVKTWDQQKVKLTTTVFYYDKDDNTSDQELLDKSNITLKVLGSSVKIKSGSTSGSTLSSFNGRVYSEFYAYADQYPAQVITTNSSRSNFKRALVIYVPGGTKIDIECKYGDVQLPGGINEATVDITNGNLEGGDLSKLILRSKYTSVNLGDVKDAEVELTNGRFSAKNIDNLDIDSKNSNVELAIVKKLTIRSTSDEYEMEDVTDLHGRKNYGNLRITRLNGQFELDGVNADIRIKNVSAAVTSIKVDNKYADIRIPLRSAKNYFIDFAGSYSSVYGDFEKKPVAVEKTAPKDEKEKTVTGYSSTSEPKQLQATTFLRLSEARGGNDTPSKFTATVGDGRGIKIDMKCQNCTVDFK